MMLLLSGPHGLGKYLDETTLADRGYVGLGLVTPTKRQSGQRLIAETRKNNRLLESLTVGG